MNWYKQSKLADKNINTGESPINTQCMYCGRWSTHPYSDKPNRDEIVWKKQEELDKEEREGVKNAKRVSHGLCEFCLDVINNFEKQDIAMYDLDNDQIRDLSLERS